ncbi:GntR family transcriptional regulator [Spirochaetia bacterium]|nr:GntR family transcriptional regulator [Spirochaetia bacterium]GHV91947.1 GntR family transcriptional regulator [Spirochaetia bacterium]
MENSGRLRSGALQDSVYSALRDSIINLNLAPGTAISEKEISLRFNVSRTPVRETFIHLSKEGLVKVIPQKETLVSLIDLRRVEQEFFLRESLETAVLEPFLRHCGPVHFAELEKLLDLQGAALKNNAYTDFINYDDRFHQIFFEASGQGLSWEVLSGICGHYHRARMLTIHVAGIANEKLGQHGEILSALKKKDADKARALLYTHLHKLDMEEKLLREKFPAYFVPEEEKNVFDVDFGGMPRLA